MDIVEELRADELPEDRQSKREARMELGKLLDRAADEIERLRSELEYYESEESAYGVGFGDGFEVGATVSEDLVKSADDLIRTIRGLVQNGSLELKCTEEGGQFLGHALNRLERALEEVQECEGDEE